MAAGPSNRKQMLAKMPEAKQTPPVLPPQVFSDMTYLGDFDSFFDAREQELPFTWLKLTPPVGSREEQMVRSLKQFQHLTLNSGCRIQVDQRTPAILIHTHLIQHVVY